MEAWSDTFLYHIDMPFVNYLKVYIGVRPCHREKVFSYTIGLMAFRWIRPDPKLNSKAADIGFLLLSNMLA